MIQPRGEIAAAQIRQYEKSAQTIIFHPPFRIPKIFFVGGAIDMSVFAEIFFKHAEYGGFKALIDIQNSCVIRGALPGRQLKLILAWCELHKDELMQNWELARTAAPLNHIAPLI